MSTLQDESGSDVEQKLSSLHILSASTKVEHVLNFNYKILSSPCYFTPHRSSFALCHSTQDALGKVTTIFLTTKRLIILFPELFSSLTLSVCYLTIKCPLLFPQR